MYRKDTRNKIGCQHDKGETAENAGSGEIYKEQFHNNFSTMSL